MGGRPHPGGQGVRGRPQRRPDARAPRDPHRARPAEPPPRPAGGGEPRPLPPHARGRVRGRREDAPRQDRHGRAQPQPARPRDVPDPARAPSPHREPVVHLSHVRLGARALRLPRARHALDLHAGVRGPPAALRLVPRRARRLSPAADRVRAAQPEPHRDEQAPAPGAGGRPPRDGLGRSPHAHPGRAPPPRLYAGGHPRLLRADRRGQGGQHGGHRAARALHPRGSQPPRRPRDGGAPPPAPRHRELPRGPGGGAGRGEQPRRSGHGHAEAPLLSRAPDRAGRLPRGPAEEVFPARAGRRGAAPLRLLRPLHRGDQGPRHRPDHRGALHLRPRHARRRRPRRPAGQGHHPLGVGRARGPRRGAPVREPLHQGESRRTKKTGSTGRRISIPPRIERITDARVEPGLAGAKPGSRYQFERVGYFAVDPDSRAGALVFNRTVGLRDTWAKIERADKT